MVDRLTWHDSCTDRRLGRHIRNVSEAPTSLCGYTSPIGPPRNRGEMCQDEKYCRLDHERTCRNSEPRYLWNLGMKEHRRLACCHQSALFYIKGRTIITIINILRCGIGRVLFLSMFPYLPASYQSNNLSPFNGLCHHG